MAVYFTRRSSCRLASRSRIAPLTVPHAVSPPCSSNASAPPADAAPVVADAAAVPPPPVDTRYVVDSTCHELKYSHCSALLGIAPGRNSCCLPRSANADALSPVNADAAPVVAETAETAETAPIDAARFVLNPCCHFRFTLSPAAAALQCPPPFWILALSLMKTRSPCPSWR